MKNFMLLLLFTAPFAGTAAAGTPRMLSVFTYAEFSFPHIRKISRDFLGEFGYIT